MVTRVKVDGYTYNNPNETDLEFTKYVDSETNVVTPIIENLEYVTLTVFPNPEEATVVLTADGYQQEGNSITVLSGGDETAQTGIFDLLLRLNRQHEGEILVDKIDINEYGDEAYFDEVAAVKALIDVSDLPTVEVGKQTIENVKLKAYDKTGSVVDVEFVPETISAEVEISAPSKEVNLNFVPTGSMPFGKAISSYNFSTNKVTVYGTNNVISGISAIDIKVDVSKLNSDTELDVDIPKPTGVKSLSQNSVKVKVFVTDVATKSNVYSVNITGVNTILIYNCINACDIRMMLECRFTSSYMIFTYI